MFQKSPMKLAKRTRYCIGTYMKLIIVAAGHIFQLVSIVTLILSFQVWNPFFMPSESNVWIKLWNIKNPERNIGANINWSINIPVNANFNWEAFAPTNFGTILGIMLQYHTWRHGAKYRAPVMVKLTFLFQSKDDFCSMAEDN